MEDNNEDFTIKEQREYYTEEKAAQVRLVYVAAIVEFGF